MKYLVWFLTVISMFFSFGNISNAANPLFGDSTDQVPYCNYGECGLEEGIDAVIDINALEVEDSASEYVQRVVVYILGFLAILAVFLIVYAGFNLLTAVGDEEKAKKSKQIIFYTILGVFVIFIASPLIEFIINALNS